MALMNGCLSTEDGCNSLTEGFLIYVTLQLAKLIINHSFLGCLLNVCVISHPNCLCTQVHICSICRSHCSSSNLQIVFRQGPLLLTWEEIVSLFSWFRSWSLNKLAYYIWMFLSHYKNWACCSRILLYVALACLISIANQFIWTVHVNELNQKEMINWFKSQMALLLLFRIAD